MSSASLVILETESRTCTGGHSLVADAKSCPQCDEPAAPTAEANPAGNRNAKREANRAARQAESQAAWRALSSRIVEGRRKTLSTLTGVASVAMLGLAAFGILGRSGSILASAVAPLVLAVCCLCWRRERDLTRAEYLALPHAQARTGRLRCIHCDSLGPVLPERDDARRSDCLKCGATLFAA